MRPDRDEMLAGVRRALVEFVAPEVKTVYGRTELTYAITLVSMIGRESEDAVANLVRENSELRRLLRAAGRRLQGRPLADAALTRELAAVGLADRQPDLRLSALRAESGALFSLFIRLQAACEEDASGDRTIASVGHKTLAFLRARSDAQLGLPRR